MKMEMEKHYKEEDSIDNDYHKIETSANSRRRLCLDMDEIMDKK